MKKAEEEAERDLKVISSGGSIAVAPQTQTVVCCFLLSNPCVLEFMACLGRGFQQLAESPVPLEGKR